MGSDYWVILDTETDGLEAPIHVIEIAAQIMNGTEPEGPLFQVYIDHDIEIPQSAFEIHGYNQAFIKQNGVSPEIAYEMLREYVNGYPVAAHYLNFDWDRVLVPEWDRLGISVIGKRGFCLLDLAKRIVCETNSFKLDELLNVFEIDQQGRHTASGDVEALVKLFNKVYSQRLERARLRNFNSWAVFSTARPLSICLGRAIPPDDLRVGLLARAERGAKRRWEHFESGDIFYRQDLTIDYKRMLKRCDSEGNLDPREVDFLRKVFLKFENQQTSASGMFVFKWMRENLPKKGVLSSEESLALLAQIKKVLDAQKQQVLGYADKYDSSHLDRLSDLESPEDLPFDEIDEIQIKNRSFCFTGKFKFGTRKKCEEAVINAGGRCTRRPVLDTDFLVVGDLGGFGSKVDEIQSLRDRGSTASMIFESTWTAVIGNENE